MLTKFIKIPTQIAKTSEIQEAEITDNEVDWKDGFAVINVDALQMVTEDTEGCNLYFLSGDTLFCTLSLDELATLLDSK